MTEEAMTDGAALPIPAQPQAVAPRDFRAGTAALAEMPVQEFEARLASMARGRERLKRIHRELMSAETDYGVIPGTGKPTLLKPGAEKLCDFYRLAAEFRPVIRRGETFDEPAIMIITECRLHLGSLDGPVVNTGHGAANSWETRYRYRRGERTCPSCGKAGAIVKGKQEYGGGWICFGKKGGCGAKWPDGAAVIEQQAVGDVENADPYDLLNTLLKMAEKRCLGGTTPVLVKSAAGILRCNVSQLYSMLNRGENGPREPLYLPGIDGKSWRRVEGMVRDEGREVYRIDLSDGSYIRATAEHRFPTRDGLSSVGDLKAGDVLLRSGINMGDEEKADPEFGWIAGLFIAEGCYANEGRAIRLTLHEDETDLVERVRCVADRLGATNHITPKQGKCIQFDIHGAAFCGLVRQFVDGEGSGGKHLSRYCWRQGEKFLAALLEGYLAGDGCHIARKGRNPYWGLGFTGENGELAEDLRSMAAILGHRLSLKRSNAKLRGVEFPTFRGWVKPNLTTYNQKDLGRIVSIKKETNPAVVYDIQVDGDHLFCIANGIQTHNSYVDATLRATATSGLYTQDMEEAAHQEAAGSPPAGGATPKRQPASSPKESPEIAVCSVAGCGAVLSADEIRGSHDQFGGVLYCKHHGKEQKALKKVEEAEAADAADAAAQKADPFIGQ